MRAHLLFDPHFDPHLDWIHLEGLDGTVSFLSKTSSAVHTIRVHRLRKAGQRFESARRLQYAVVRKIQNSATSGRTVPHRCRDLSHFNDGLNVVVGTSRP